MEDWNLNTTRLQRNIVLQSAPSYSVSVSSHFVPRKWITLDPPIRAHRSRVTTRGIHVSPGPPQRSWPSCCGPSSFWWPLGSKRCGTARAEGRTPRPAAAPRSRAPPSIRSVTREMAASKTRPQDRWTQQDPAFQFVMMIEREWLGGFVPSNDDLWEFL